MQVVPALFLFLIALAECTSTNDWPVSASGKVQTNWTGTWHGVLEAYPEGELGNGWNVTLEIGTYPMVDNMCTTWRSVFTDNSIVQATKDYRFCRGSGADDLYIDEGGNVTIAARWISEVLVSPFKYKGVFAVSSMRIRGDILEEEILITDDNLSIENVVVSVRPHSIHLMTMRRMPTANTGQNAFSSRCFFIDILFISFVTTKLT